MESEKETKLVRKHMPYARVLIVDDVEFSLSVAKGLMKPYGLTVETVACGYEALEKIQSGSAYDIIFMDCIMPEIDGIETTRLIRNENYTHPIIAMSANIILEQTDEGFNNGFDDFIAKPISVSKLNDILNKWIQDKHIQHAPSGELDGDSSETREIVEEEPIFNNAEHNHIIIIEKLRDIDYINVDSALDAVGDLTDVLVDSMKLFARRLPETVTKMDKSVTIGNAKEIATIAHGLKSVLKSIGSLTLAGIATDLENAGTENDISFCRNTYPQFKDALLSLSENLSTALADKSSVTKKHGDKALLLQALADVKNAMEDYNRDKALELLAPLADFSYDESTDALLLKTVFALEEFDWDSAADTIELI